MDDAKTGTRRNVLYTLGGVLTVGLAGCNTLGGDQAAEPPSNATSSPTGTSPPTDESTETESPTDTPESTGTHEHTDGHDHTHEQTSTPPEDQGWVENPEEVHAQLEASTSVASDEVLIGLRLEDSGLPFTTEVYPSPDDAEVHATETYDTQELSEIPLLPDQPSALSTLDTDNEDVHYGTTTIGQPLKVTLVARHDDEDYDWSAWRRTGHPYDGHREENPYLSVDCYCGGENYVAPGGGTWARVIQVTPTERVDAGTTIALNWIAGEL